MHHVFITPLAWDLSEYHSPQHLLKSPFREALYESYEDRIFRIVDYWVNYTSKFYTRQNSEDTFEVFLLYSKRFLPILEMFFFPWWVKLVECTPEQIASDSCLQYLDEDFKKKYEGLPISISRTDADDYFSNDIFNIISGHQKKHKDSRYLIIYKKFRQYFRWSKQYTKELVTPDDWSSGNITLILNPYTKKIEKDKNPFIKNLDLLGFHAELYSQCRSYEEYRCSFIQTLGCNLGNTKWTDEVDEFFESEDFTQV